MRLTPFLALAGLTKGRFGNLQARGQLPFESQDGWTDYTLTDAFRLRLMLDAAETFPLPLARELATVGADSLGLLPFYLTGDTHVFAAVAKATLTGETEATLWPVSGRAEDVGTLSRDRFKPGELTAVFAADATKAARATVVAGMKVAAEYGLPPSEYVVSVPENLAGLPMWFREMETARRAVLSEATE